MALIADKKVSRRHSLFLLILAVFAFAVLTIFNHKTTKLNAAMRAYITCESQSSKAQAVGIRYLLIFVESGDENHFDLFEQNMSVPLNISRTLHGLIDGESETAVEELFLKSGVGHEDAQSIVWFYSRFKTFSLMKSSFEPWQRTDSLRHVIMDLGTEIKQVHNERDSIPISEKIAYTNRINTVADTLSEKDQQLTQHMSKLSQTSVDFLFWLNTIVILVMLFLVVIFSGLLIRQLEKSRLELKQTNAGLRATSDKLSNFINATSHNLKAPINNMQGLINIMNMREGADALDISLREKMSASVSILAGNINRIEKLMNMDSTPDIDSEWIHLRQLFLQVIEENQYEINSSKISILTKFKVEDVFYSANSLKEIFWNLISNAIKYSNPMKSATLTISSFREGDYYVIRFSDNGLGVDLSPSGNEIFELFKRYHKDLSGSGVGLYIVKQIVERNGGLIKVDSKVGEGTVFDIFLQKI